MNMKTSICKSLILTLPFSILMTLSLPAQDRQLARTYQSNTLPKGARDLEGQLTYRAGRNYFFNELDGRLEFETGLTDKLQTSVYMNISGSAYGPNLDTLGGIPVPAASGIEKEVSFSLSNEWKWNLLNASVDPVGLALYAEFLVGPGQFEIENKIIVDKRWASGLMAFNLVNEYEGEKNVFENKTTRELSDEVNMDLGYMHFIKQGFGIGAEFVNSNEIEAGSWNFSALSGGPTLYFAGKNDFCILNILPQWANLHKTADAPTDLVLNDHEKIEMRLLWGFSL